MSWLDRLLGRRAPSSDLRASGGAYFDGATTGRRGVAFSAPRTGPNTPVITSGATLTDRTYALVRNEPFVRRGINALCAGMVGTGIMPRCELDEQPELQEAVHTLWDQSMEELDADGATDGYGLQALAIRGVLMGGDCFPRFRPRRATDRARFMPVPLAVPLQVQLLESEMVPRDKNERLPNGRRILGGIQFGPAGQIEGFHVYKDHPSERAITGFAGYPETTFVPADAIAHVHEMGRPGQVRGEPRCASILLPAQDFKTGEDALQQSWNLAAVLSGFIETSNPDELPLLSPDERAEAAAANDGKATVTLEAGEMPVLNPGEKFTQAKPPDVGATYSAAVKNRLRRIAAGLDCPYELLAMDLEGVTYSSARIGLLEFWSHCDQFLWQTLVPQFLRPLYLVWFDTAVRAGKLPLTVREYLADPRKYLAATWIPPQRPWVDPLNDVQGEVLAMENGLAARDELILRRGGIPERIDRSRARSKRRAEELGVSDGKVEVAPTQQGARVTPPALQQPQQQSARRAA